MIQGMRRENLIYAQTANSAAAGRRLAARSCSLRARAANCSLRARAAIVEERVDFAN